MRRDFGTGPWLRTLRTGRPDRAFGAGRRSAVALLIGLAGLAGLGGGAAAVSFEGLRLDELSATRERPLFPPTRRPRPEPPPPPPAPEPVAIVPQPEPEPVEEPASPPSATLTGVVIGGDLRLAVFLDAEGKPLSVRQGDEIEGWTVADVQRRSVTIERDGETLELKLKAPGDPE